MEIKTGEIGLKNNDIILEVNGKAIEYTQPSFYINFDAYYNVHAKVIIKIYRPCTGKYMTFKVIPDKFPSALNFVSIDPSLKLVSNTSATYYPPGYSLIPWYFTLTNKSIIIPNPISNNMSGLYPNNSTTNYCIASFITSVTGIQKTNKTTSIVTYTQPPVKNDSNVRIIGLYFTHYLITITEGFTTFDINNSPNPPYTTFNTALSIGGQYSEGLYTNVSSNILSNLPNILLGDITISNNNITGMLIRYYPIAYESLTGISDTFKNTLSNLYGDVTIPGQTGVYINNLYQSLYL